MHAVFWFETLNRKDHFQDLGVDGKTILEYI